MADEFWQSDPVATSDSDWWKQDEVKPSTATVTTSAATSGPPTLLDSPAEIDRKLAGRKSSGPPGVLIPKEEPFDADRLEDTEQLKAWVTEGLPFHKLAASAQTVQDAFDVLKAMNLAGVASPKGPSLQKQLEGPSTPPSTEAKVVAGLHAAALTVPETMTSPLGIATLGAGAAGPAAARVVSGAFAADMARNTPEQVVDVYEAFKLELGPEEATRRIGALALNTAMLAASAKHAVTDASPGARAGRMLAKNVEAEFVKPGDLLPQPKVLEIAAVRAEAAGAPATAEAVMAQAIEPISLSSATRAPEAAAAEAPKGIAASARAKLTGESVGSESGAVSLPTWTARPLVRPAGEIYSEPMAERIRRLGGPVSARVADEALQIVDHAKRMYGDLSARVLDDAKQSAGKAFRGGTTWIQGTAPVTERAATSRFHEVLEERVRTGNFNHVPAQYRPFVLKLWDTNLEIGRLAQQAAANPQFLAIGRPQRMLTAYGHDIVMRGRGRAWEVWSEGWAVANGRTTGEVQHFLRAWKAEMDRPGADAAGLDRIAQDFVRQFPNVVTHIKPLLGWHEVVHSSPFSYLEQAAQRTANAVAFRQVHPVGSGSLEATRTAVQAELQTDTAGKIFDNTMRALQGHPIDQFTGSWNAPDTVLGATMRGTQIVTKPLRSAMLTASLATNVGETLSGGAQIFLGYRNAIRGAIRNRTLYQDMKRRGTVNEAIRDFSFDPNNPLRSVARYAGNLISRVFLNDFANEIQEYTGAATARLVADEVRIGTIDAGTKIKVVNTMRAMGITKENAQAAADGRNPEALNQFETKAAEFLSGGSQATGEKSRLGASRAFGELFWFHSYPMSKVRQTRSVLNNIIEDATAKDWASAYQNSKLLGRVLGGTALGGAITIGVLTLVREGLFGAEIKKNEAQDDFGDFVKESFLMGFGGPLSIANRIWEQGGGIDEAASGLVLSSAPLSLAKELSDAATQSGRYEGMTPVETVGEFLQSKTPGLRPFKYGMAAWGLAQDDPEFDSAARAFYRWRNDKFGSVKYKSNLKEDKERKEFRGHMKQAVAALKDGDMEKFEVRVDKAADVAGSNKAIKQSFESRKLLRTPSGKAIDGDELEELRVRIGDKALEKLIGFDAMLESLSR